MTKGINLNGEECDVEKGNIKFFAHGLGYVNQLAKFDAFGLIDSDVLLSVSYAERPESKYRFFRAQGVLLDVDTKYIQDGRLSFLREYALERDLPFVVFED